MAGTEEMLAIIIEMPSWRCGLEIQGKLKTSLSSVTLMILLNYLRLGAIFLFKTSILRHEV